ncbi:MULTISPECIES: YvrJ family protein [Bacillaceae]|uniref:YvrJ family protein n=1 Tax=Bacillaceae TaxID=186817 RepID=UPI001E54FE5D|nr:MULTISPECIES: YvrJ family protein [Bacillaceae]MCE4050608.1 YvrJ family protein [Bacillus sp. Au-Bac7]MCM3031992.1 YvrJ family protein [Niallia sp. MER 6]MDL0436003.1 YvrJ family protein [Niallia sp. SS-2023]UPO87870.1 YvrJ family protein [Niallia sp. Man26]
MSIGDLTQWMTIVSNYAFPVSVSIYLLLRIDKKLERLGKELTKRTEEGKENG